jgi:hypothetical protein
MVASGVGVGGAAAAPLAVTDCDDSGAPTRLRALIATAAPEDTIGVPACTITPSQGSPLVIGQDLTIRGAGAARTILDGAHITPVSNVTAGTVAIADLRCGTAPAASATAAR